MTYELRLTNRRLEAAREGAAACGHHRSADRLPQPAVSRAGDGPRAAAPRAVRAAAVAALHRRRSLQGGERHARPRRRRPRAAVRRALPEAPHPRSGLRLPLGRRRVPRADHLHRRRSAREGRGAEGRVRCGAGSGRAAARHRAERRLGRGAGRHDDLLPLVNAADARMYEDKGARPPVRANPVPAPPPSVAADNRHRRDGVDRLFKARAHATDRLLLGSLKRASCAGRRPGGRFLRRPSPSAAHRRRRGSNSLRSSRTPGRE